MALGARLDAVVGRGLEDAVRLAHERRLRRLGRAGVLDPGPGRWARTGPPARGGNRVDVLVDGAEAFPAMVEALDRARSHVHLATWHLAPDFVPERGGGGRTALELLAAAAERADVRVLHWAGAPSPFSHPNRRDAHRACTLLARASGARVALEALPSVAASIHEKVLVVDDRVAFVGGLDFTDVLGDRYDSSEHRWRGASGWHDAVARVEGPAVGDLAAHFALRWGRATGEELAVAPPDGTAGALEVQVARTLPEGVYAGHACGEFGVLEAYLGALRGARRLVYLESQYLWSVEVVRELARKLRRPPCDDFRVVLVLPTEPKQGVDDTQGQLRVLAHADAGAGRLVACSLQARLGRVAAPVYVHAKLAVVDDEWLTIGSANLNDLSLLNSTEVNVVVADPALARGTRERLWAEHLELPAASGDPARLVDDVWRPIADEQLARRTRGDPPTHRLFRLPYRSRRSTRLLGPVQNLVTGT